MASPTPFIFDYADLVGSGIPLSVFADACGLKNARAWQKDGIPVKFQPIIARVFSKKSIKINSLKIPTPKSDVSHCLQSDLFESSADKKKSVKIDFSTDYTLNNNSLPENAAKLVMITKFQAANPPFSPYKLPAYFARIKPLEPVEIDTKNKVLVSASADLKTYSCPITGELFDFVRRGKKWLYSPSPDFVLAERYALLSTARSVLSGSRVVNCLRSRLPAARVGLHRSKEFGHVFYSGLQICGLVWPCPVCAAKISERRRCEVQSAHDQHKSAGGFFSFVGRTVPHTSAKPLAELLAQFAAATGRYRGLRAYKRIMAKYGVIGRINAHEMTVTFNGWHWHTHEIYFHDQNAPAIAGNMHWLKDFHAELYPLWRDSAVAVGLDEPSFAHGLHVQNGDFVAAYIAKWGMEPLGAWTEAHELTRQHIKKSRSGLSPFDLLRQYRATGLLFYAELFREYAVCMKGEQQLRWSSGLKKRFGIGEVSDEELAAEKLTPADCLGFLADEDWSYIVLNRYEAYILILARSGGFSAVEEFLDRSFYADTSPPDRSLYSADFLDKVYKTA